MNSPQNQRPLQAATLCARGGKVPPSVVEPSVSPIYLTTAFDFESLDQINDVAAGRSPGYIYTRDGNPNHDALARDVATLEGAESGIVTASGMGALTATLGALLRPGDHMIAARALYGRTMQLLHHWAETGGIHVSFVDTQDLASVAQSIRPETKLALVETVSNPLVEVIDLAAVSRTLGTIPLLVDNTFATPCLVKPLAMGASLVWHSASKYLNGHGDAMLGVIVGHERLIRKVKSVACLLGVNSNPFESWLGSRGLRTLPLRMTRVSASAGALALRLQQHPRIKRVFYPGLTNHPTHEIAARQMHHGFGGMLSFELDQGRDGVNKLFHLLVDSLPFSPTLADARTTLSYPAGTSHKFMSGAERAACGVTEGIVRLSVGLEDVDDIWRDLSDALSKL